jgi:hypothetical protein
MGDQKKRRIGSFSVALLGVVAALGALAAPGAASGARPIYRVRASHVRAIDRRRRPQAVRVRHRARPGLHAPRPSARSRSDGRVCC